MPSRIDAAVVPGEAIDPRNMKVTPTTTKSLSQFTRLSPDVRLYTPPPPSASDAIPRTHPTTILLCVWLNAIPKHIEYYAQSYMKRFPHARIILVTITSFQFLAQTEVRRRADMQPAVAALRAADPATDRLFVHSLSNGGAKRLYNIASAYAAATGRPLPAKAWLLDSAPGIPQFRRDIHALTVPAHNWPWMRWLPFMAIVVSITSVVWVATNWMPKWFWAELVWRPTAGSYDPRLVERACVRGYVYSKEDQAIDWRDVERHAAGGEERGLRVERMLVEGAEHVQLFRGVQGEKGYWGFMQKVWDLGNEGEGKEREEALSRGS